MSAAICVAPTTVMRPEPGDAAEADTELLYGERVAVEAEAEGYVRVVATLDGYRGWIAATALGPEPAPATHRVTASSTHVYARAHLKSPVRARLPFNAKLAARVHDDEWAAAAGGYVFRKHLAPVGATADDFVAVAERFVGVPYLWGGKTPFGFDCSGLVQASLEACGVAAPRDSKVQAGEVGVAVAIPPSLQGLQRGDLVFWKGHVGIMRDATSFLHANAHHMTVAIEPIRAAVDRNAAKGLPVTVVRRLQ